jgi:predicted transcriptional regulator
MSSSYSIGVFMDHRVKELLDILASSQGTTSEVILGSALRQQIILHKEDLQASMQKRYKTEIDELQNELPKLIEEKNKTEQIMMRNGKNAMKRTPNRNNGTH